MKKKIMSKIRFVKAYHATGGGGGSVGNQVISDKEWQRLVREGWTKVRRDLPDIGKSWAVSEYFVHPEDVGAFIAEYSRSRVIN